jgi:type VI secretion system protein ImpG
MDPRLLHYYNQELQHLREMGAEFAQQFPKIAARLGMEGIEVADPYVERLMEGVAFLAARVQLKLDAEFPRFTQRLLEIAYPNLLAPTPAMLVAQFLPDLNEPNLARGVRVPRATAMRSTLGSGDQTPCEFRSAHDVSLWPLEIVAAEYFSFAPDLPLASLAVGNKVRGGVRLRIRSTAGLNFDQIALDSLRIHFSGADETAYKLHELCLGASLGMLVGPPARPAPWTHYVPPREIRPAGFEDDQALLPVTLRGFQGYRLLQEYFAFPQRFLFADLGGLAPALRRHSGNELEIALLFGRGEPGLESLVDAGNFALFCTPVVNLFHRRADRIHLSPGAYEYHVVADRTRPMDFEIYEVTDVRGFGVGADSEQGFLPFYAAYHTEDSGHGAYFMTQREPRLLSAGQKRTGFRSSYIGSEVFLSLVDPQEAPFRSDLRQIAVSALCTNRDLPLLIPLGAGKTDFTLESAAPVLAIRCLRGPSRPSSPLREGGRAWLAVSHLSLNYLSLMDSGEREAAAVLREMLGLYASGSDRAGMGKQIEGVRSLRVRPEVRRLPMPGPIACGRGLEITLEVDDMAFQGGSAFLFGAVMERFFARHVSINSFTETVLRSGARGEIMRWAPRCGERAVL